MKHKHLTRPQTVNACTLISIAVIEAILAADNENEMEEAIQLAQDISQELYRQLIDGAQGHGDGVQEEDAYQRFFLKSLTKPQAQQLSSPANPEAVRTLLNIRDDMLLQDDWSPEMFLAFNLDAIEAIERQLPPESPVIDWETVTEEALTRRLNLDEKPSLIKQVSDAIAGLKDPEGITVRMEGHTISVVRSKGVFYSYDSLTGDLSSTAYCHEMSGHIAQKISTNHANALILNSFSPLSAPILETNQNCAEMMLKNVAKLVLKKDIEFRYGKDVPDEQVDISPAFLFTEDHQRQLWVSGGNQQLLEADLGKLDKAKVYFLRTGTNEGAGHWQTLYFDPSQNGWIAYSSDKNNYLLTLNDILTKRGLTILSPFAKWGKNRGEYSMLVIDASAKNITQAINFLYDYRMHGEEVAQEKAWENRDELYKQISMQAPTIDEPKVEPIDEILATLRSKIEMVEQHVYPQAHAKATELLGKLTDARKQYADGLEQPSHDAIVLKQTFLENCLLAIDVAKPILERDLGWGDYLKNLFKSLANAVIGIFSQNQTFFTIKRSGASEALEEAQHKLDNEMPKP